MKKNITIKDIAKQLGVHNSTVSRALNNHPAVNEKTRQEIQTFAKKKGYRPNYYARNIRKKHSNTIGIIVPTIDSEFFSKVISSVEKELYNNGYHIIIYQTHEDIEKEEGIIDNLLSLQICGLITCFSNNNKIDNYLEKFNDFNIPVVLFDRIRKNEAPTASKVIFNNEEIYQTITTYLLQRGKKKIAFFSGCEGVGAFEDRINAYKQVLTANQVPINPSLIFRNIFDERQIEKALETSLNRGIDAIIITNEKTYIETVLMIKKRGLVIPDDILPMGASNHIVNGLLKNPIPTIKFFPEKMGQTAANILIKSNKCRSVNQTVTKIIKAKLIQEK